ncbi:MAG: dihydroorotase [Synechococcales bacterium]|nr:dihydroorotase [Synechococcales bacterium]
MTIELLQQVHLIDAVSGHDRTVDVLLHQGKIAAIESMIAPPSEAILWDATDWVLGPGLVDLYSQSGEPGHEDREPLNAFLSAAIAGGFTQVNLLPSTQPAIDSSMMLTGLQEQITHYASAYESLPQGMPLQVNCWAALTQNTVGQQMVEWADLQAAIGFTDGKPLTSLPMVRRILEYLQPSGKPVMLWAYHPGLAGNGVAREGTVALQLGLPGIPVMAEAVPLASLLELVREIGTPVHFMRIATARSVELLQSAKSAGLPVTASTTWMHLCFATADLATYDPTLRLSPPVGNEVDRQALVQAVKTGVIDAIAVDHQAYTYEEKTVAFGEAPAGAIGLELVLPILWQRLVGTGQLTAVELWRSLSCQPLACLGQPIAPLQIGDSNLILFDPTQSWQCDRSTLKSAGDNTPFFGQPLQGRVIKTWRECA